MRVLRLRLPQNTRHAPLRMTAHLLNKLTTQDTRKEFGESSLNFRMATCDDAPLQACRVVFSIGAISANPLFEGDNSSNVGKDLPISLCEGVNYRHQPRSLLDPDTPVPPSPAPVVYTPHDIHRYKGQICGVFPSFLGAISRLLDPESQQIDRILFASPAPFAPNRWRAHRHDPGLIIAQRSPSPQREGVNCRHQPGFLTPVP